ncbi:MAG: helix-turn-helix domain-containing protein [Anaerovoracaceae bacterium]
MNFKSDLKLLSKHDIFDAVMAFSNTEGGDLYLGVEDNGNITGVHRDLENPTTLSAFIANNTVPPVSIRAEIIEGVSMTILCIQRQMDINEARYLELVMNLAKSIILFQGRMLSNPTPGI